MDTIVHIANAVYQKNGMIKVIKYCFEKWWRPLLFFGMTTLVFGIGEASNEPALFEYSFYFFVLGLFVLLASAVYQLIRKKWLFGFLTLATLVLGISGFFISVIWQFWTDQIIPDRYADHLIIPEDIEIYEPLDERWKIRNDSISQLVRREYEFDVYKSFQQGLYEFDIWLGKTDSGTVYLKVYEVTQNDRLSIDRLTERSSIRVGNSTEEVKRFGTQDYFKVYEGDFGKPYAARFEVWYQSADGKERKLTEKNYKIEGWQH